jgi:hypothetical protein
VSAATAVRPNAIPQEGVTAARVLRSEWTKFRTLRSTTYVVLAAVVLQIGIGLLVPWANARHSAQWDVRQRLDFDPAALSLGGIFLAQLAVGVLGVLAMSGEHATGMIRATLAAVPRRLPVLWAKAAVFAGAVLALTTGAALGSFLVGQIPLASRHLGAPVFSSASLEAIAGAALYLTLIGLLGVALGGLLRNTAAGIASLVAFVLVIPVVVQTFPQTWRDHVEKYLPGSIADSMITAAHDSGSLSRWAGFGVLAAYVAVTFVGAAVVLLRRDA